MNIQLSNIKVDQPRDGVDATITLDEEGFSKVLLGQARLATLIESNEATLEGDGSVLQKLASTLVQFDPAFEIVPFSEKTVDADLYQ